MTKAKHKLEPPKPGGFVLSMRHEPMAGTVSADFLTREIEDLRKNIAHARSAWRKQSDEHTAIVSIFFENAEREVGQARDHLDRDEIVKAWFWFLAAHHQLGAAMLYPDPRRTIRAMASKGGDAKKAADPLQAVKAEVRIFWQAERARLGGKFRAATFAIEAMRRWPKLDRARTVENWCTAWKKSG